jgi:serine/threonine-protein kinase SRK2
VQQQLWAAAGLVLTQLCCSCYCVLQMVQGLPLPLLKICDFGYSKAHFMSAPKSKVGVDAAQELHMPRAAEPARQQRTERRACSLLAHSSHSS